MPLTIQHFDQVVSSSYKNLLLRKKATGELYFFSRSKTTDLDKIQILKTAFLKAKFYEFLVDSAYLAEQFFGRDADDDDVLYFIYPIKQVERMNCISQQTAFVNEHIAYCVHTLLNNIEPSTQVTHTISSQFPAIMQKMESITEQQIKDCINSNYYPPDNELNIQITNYFLSIKRAFYEAKDYFIRESHSPQSAVKTYTKNEHVILASYNLDKRSLRYASTKTLASLISKTSWLDIDAITNFPDNEEIILALYAKKSPSFIMAFDKSIIRLIDKKVLSAEQIIKDFPEEIEFIKKLDPKSVIKLIAKNKIKAEHAIKAFPNNKEVVLAAYDHVFLTIQPSTFLKNAADSIIVELVDRYIIHFDTGLQALSDCHLLLRTRTNEKISDLLQQKQISPKDALRVYPKSRNIILIAYYQDAKSIQDANEQEVLKLVQINWITYQDAFLAFPKNKSLLWAMQRQHVIQMIRTISSSPSIHLDQIGQSIVETFPEDRDIVLSMYHCNPKSLSYASKVLILLLMGKQLSYHSVVMAFCYDEDLVLMACREQPTSLFYAAKSLVLDLLRRNKVSPESVSINFPDHEYLVWAAYQKQRESIKHAAARTVLKLMEKRLVSHSDAANAFPDNEEIIAQAFSIAVTETHDVVHLSNVIHYLANNLISPYDAVKSHPQEIEVIKAAYAKKADSIKYADKEIINQLGLLRVIKTEDVLHLFSISPGTNVNSTPFNFALSQKDWPNVAAMCQKFWFEKPREATKEKVIKKLIAKKEWDDLYAFEKQFEQYKLVYGPKEKAKETTELEQLMRKMMTNLPFRIVTINKDDYFEFKDQQRTKFNWSRIQTYADYQQLELTQKDFDLFENFVATQKMQHECTLQKKLEHHYRKQLYRDLEEWPKEPITFAEMLAINSYTADSYYLAMNGLMCDEKVKFDYRLQSTFAIRKALIYTVMCASGLKKIPNTQIKESFRTVDLDLTDETHLTRVTAAAKKEVIALKGFISSSVVPLTIDHFRLRPIMFRLKNINGAYIAPIAHHPEEEEYLIPPTQIQFTSYKQELSGQHCFEATGASDISNTKEPIPLFIKSAGLRMDFKHSGMIVKLVRKGTLCREDANKIYPSLFPTQRALSSSLSFFKVTETEEIQNHTTYLPKQLQTEL